MSFISTLDVLRQFHRLETFEAASGLSESFWSAYASFANSEGGTIVLGVSEDSDGSFVATGLSDAQRTLEELWLGVTDPSRVSACVLTRSSVHTERVGSADLVVIEVPRAPRRFLPVHVGADSRLGTFRHSENGWYRVSDEEYGSLRRSSEAAFDDVNPLVDLLPTSLDDESVLAYREALQARCPEHPYLKLQGEAFLCAIGVLGWDTNGALHPTRAGLLLLGHECDIASVFPGFALDYRLVLTRRRWDEHYASSDPDRVGNLFEFWRFVRQSLSDHLRDVLARNGSLPAKEAQRLREGLSEALLNALIHSDYAGDGGVSVVLGTECFEVSNPGLALPGVPAIAAGGVSERRNPGLAALFQLIGFGPQAGGFPALRSLAAGYALPAPELVQTYGPDRLSCRVYLANQHDVAPKPKPASKPVPAPALEPAPKPQPQAASPELPASAPAEPTLFDPQLEPLRAAAQPTLETGTVPAQTALDTAWLANVLGNEPTLPLPLAPAAQAPAPAAEQPPAPAPDGAAQTASAPASSQAPVPANGPSTSTESPAPSPVQPFIAGDTAAAVVDLVTSRGTVRRTDVEELLGVGPSRAKAILAALVDQGLIAKIGSGRRTGYTLP